MTMNWHAALLSPPYSILTYAVPDYFPEDQWHPGQRILVPLGRSLRAAVLLDSRPEPEELERDLKPIFWPLEQTPILPAGYLELVRDLAARHCLSLGRVLAAVLPAELRSSSVTVTVSEPGSTSSKRIGELFKDSRERLHHLATLWQTGRMTLKPAGQTRPMPSFAVAVDPPWPLRPQARRQMQLLDVLWEHGPLRQKTLRNTLGPGISQTLAALESKGLVHRIQQDEAEQAPLPEPDRLDDFELTAEQQRVYARLSNDLQAGQLAIRLLHGVTGSGKTLIYLLMMRDCLQQGRSALLLVPEVALAWKAFAEMQRFLQPHACYLYHGYQGSAQRSEIYADISRHQGPVAAVGTRSAVFLPREDWGVIVIDEEHDGSFKQEERFPYQAKEVAYTLARRQGSLLLLGSATPDVKTYHSARQGHLDCLSLTERISRQQLPDVELVNLTGAESLEGPFHPQVHEQLQACLERGEQAIILLNRRGYAPLVYCTGCKQVVTCQHCNVGLTYHKKRERLLCHYCGLSKPFPSPCPSCGGHQFLPISEGTEQVEEYLSSRLGREAGVLRLDRDNTRRKGSMEAILEDFAAGRAQVLVGTQMCSKGHHFPEVTLVVVVDGDIGLNLPDYRATEKTYQLLVQVAGRAGRGQRPGRVLIQTRNPSHYCWQFIADSDYQGFFDQEIERRRALSYPPFIKLGLLRLSFPTTSHDGPDILKRVSERLRIEGRERGLRVLGPTPAPLSQLRGRLRYNCLIKAKDWQQIRSIYTAARTEIPARASLRMSLDLDPIQML
jgi:primosomal protein N' (replication factor Y)